MIPYYRKDLKTRKMKNLFTLLLSVCGTFLFAQSVEYEASDKYPFGKPHPDAPEAISDFESMIGKNDCLSLNRNPDGTWQDTLKMVWEFRYILNGNAVQDHTWHESGLYATSIRQYNADSAMWVVGYNASNFVSFTNIPWLGKKAGDEIVLKKEQKAPNGMDGVSRLTFYNITEEGFDWKGEWVDTSGSIIFPFWKIFCGNDRK